MQTSKVSLKLLVNTKTNSVLFAEAGKDFVDFLFNIMSLPLGTVIKLLSENEMGGSLGNVYKSIEELGDTYIQPGQDKDSILSPKVIPSCSIETPLLLTEDSSSSTREFYMCNSYHCKCVTSSPSNICPQCNTRMNVRAKEVDPVASKARNQTEGGFVKGVVTYMIMDNLEVKPMSTISGITLMNQFNVKDLASLEEKVVHLCVNGALKLLKSSLESKRVLTKVFMGKNT